MKNRPSGGRGEAWHRCRINMYRWPVSEAFSTGVSGGELRRRPPRDQPCAESGRQCIEQPSIYINGTTVRLFTRRFPNSGSAADVLYDGWRDRVSEARRRERCLESAGPCPALCQAGDAAALLARRAADSKGRLRDRRSDRFA